MSVLELVLEIFQTCPFSPLPFPSPARTLPVPVQKQHLFATMEALASNVDDSQVFLEVNLPGVHNKAQVSSPVSAVASEVRELFYPPCGEGGGYNFCRGSVMQHQITQTVPNGCPLALQDAAAAIEKGSFGSPAAPPSPAGNPVKHLDFTQGAPPTPAPATPSTPALLMPTSAAVDEEETDYSQFIMDTLLWKNKVRSVCYLLGGLLVISMLKAFMSAQTSIISGQCYQVSSPN